MRELTKEEIIKLINEDSYNNIVKEYNIKIFETNEKGLLKCVFDIGVDILVEKEDLLSFFEVYNDSFYYLSKRHLSWEVF